MNNFLSLGMNFRIVSTGYNCAEYVERCVKSVLCQDGNWSMYIVDDGSTDGTFEEVKRVVDDDRIFAVRHFDNKGAALRRDEIIRGLHYNDVILLLGLDDELLPGALKRIESEYKKGKLMTYGNWQNQNGQVFPAQLLHFDEQTHKDRSYRQVKYRSTAPNTFYQWLYCEIPKTDLQVNGKWMDSTTESEVMFSCLEMCGKERIGVIEEPIYLYNENREGGTLKRLGVKYKYDIYNQVVKRPKRELYEAS